MSWVGSHSKQEGAEQSAQSQGRGPWAARCEVTKPLAAQPPGDTAAWLRKSSTTGAVLETRLFLYCFVTLTHYLATVDKGS